MTQDELNKTLYDAVLNNRISEIESLLKQGADVNAKDTYGFTPLYWASYKGYADIAKFLIDNGADVNAQNNYGLAPLHEASKSKNINVVEVLIENGADPFIKNINGQTALDLCEDKAIRAILETYMNEYNQTIDETKNNEYSIFNNALLDAVFNSDLIEVKKCVFSGKYNIDVQDDKGYTPLMYAIMDHNFDIVEFLVKNGADINLCNFKGQSPLKIAYKYDDEKIASYLLEKGALDKNQEDRKEVDSSKSI